MVLRDKPIPEVKTLKILGIIFDPNITWKNHINYLRQKGFKYLNAIKALSSKIGTRSDHILNIINAPIRSIFDYGSQLFSFSSNSNRQKLELIYNAALRLALGLPRNTPLDLLRAESMNGMPVDTDSKNQEYSNSERRLFLLTICVFCFKTPAILKGCGSPVVRVSNLGRHVMSSIPVPLKTRRVGQRCTLNLSRAETSSRWCGVVVRRGGASSGVVHVT
ncbi:putative RNA-directed DNA polymerase from transposon BS [Trichonephila clavipes]|nr:putative RNA-directed DNA polymerase from transposon BS [Trichonephila clavipes]